MTCSMNWIKVAANSLAVYVALVSLFHFGFQLSQSLNDLVLLCQSNFHFSYVVMPKPVLLF